MNVNVEDLVELAINYSLNLKQVVWILYLHEGKKPPGADKDMYMIKKDWDELTGRNIIDRNNVVSEAFVKNALSALDKQRKHESLGKLVPQISPKLDPIIEALSEILRPDPLVDTFERTLHRLDNNKMLTELFFIWLWLFPTPGEKNASWQKLFKAVYGKKFKLRVSHEGIVNRFAMFAKKYDVGTYILGTFLFVKDHIRDDGACYIPKIDNYFKVDEEWYDIAAEMVDEAKNHKDLLHVFKHKTEELGSSYTHGTSLM